MHPDADVQFHKMLKDKNQIVNSTSEVFEVDVYSPKPLIIPSTVIGRAY